MSEEILFFIATSVPKKTFRLRRARGPFFIHWLCQHIHIQQDFYRISTCSYPISALCDFDFVKLHLADIHIFANYPPSSNRVHRQFSLVKTKCFRATTGSNRVNLSYPATNNSPGSVISQKKPKLPIFLHVALIQLKHASSGEPGTSSPGAPGGPRTRAGTAESNRRSQSSDKRVLSDPEIRNLRISDSIFSIEKREEKRANLALLRLVLEVVHELELGPQNLALLVHSDETCMETRMKIRYSLTFKFSYFRAGACG